MFLKSKSLMNSVLSADDDSIKVAYIETSKTVRQLLLSIVGFSIFCLLSLGSPDLYLLGGTTYISVPFAGQMSFFLFMVIGPIILLSFRIYLHIYESHFRSLYFILNERSIILPPNLTIFNSIILKIFAAIVVYALVPYVILFFSNKVRAINIFVYPSLSLSAIVFFLHSVLLFSRIFHRYVTVKKICFIFLIILFSIIFIGLFFIDTDKLRRPLDLIRVDLSSRWLVSSDLKNAKLQGANFKNCNLSGSDLSGANLKNANFENAKLENVNFMNANLSGARFEKAILIGSNLSNAILYSTTFNSSNLLKTKFHNSKIEKTKFYENVFNDRKLYEKAKEDECYILDNGYGLREENCDKIFDYLNELTEYSTDFSKAEFIEVDFALQDCDWVKFAHATFENVSFDSAELNGSVFYKAIFWDVKFDYASLITTIFSEADFNNTTLISADLDKTHFDGVDLTDSGIDEDQINEKSCWDEKTKFPSNIDITKLNKIEDCEWPERNFEYE